MSGYEYIELKPYKGYGMNKAYSIDGDGKRMGEAVYIVDDGDDYIGEEYDTIAEAHRFIDSIAKDG